MPDVTDLIQAAAKRRQPTGGEILQLASGASSSGDSPHVYRTRKTSSRSKRSTTKTSSASSSRSQRPCKYGPRDAEGRCPKPPSRARNTGRTRTTVTARTTGGATKQAIDVITNPRATTAQKAKAVERVGESAVTEGVKSGVRKAARSATAKKGKEKLIQIATDYGRSVPVVGMAIPAYELIKSANLGPKVAAGQKTDAAIKAVKADLKKRGAKPLSKKDEQTLRKQHYEYFLKHP